MEPGYCRLTGSLEEPGIVPALKLKRVTIQERERAVGEMREKWEALTTIHHSFTCVQKCITIHIGVFDSSLKRSLNQGTWVTSNPMELENK